MTQLITQSCPNHQVESIHRDFPDVPVVVSALLSVTAAPIGGRGGVLPKNATTAAKRIEARSPPRPALRRLHYLDGLKTKHFFSLFFRSDTPFTLCSHHVRLIIRQTIDVLNGFLAREVRRLNNAIFVNCSSSINSVRAGVPPRILRCCFRTDQHATQPQAL